MSVVLAVCLAATFGPPAEVRVVGYLPDYRTTGPPGTTSAPPAG